MFSKFSSIRLIVLNASKIGAKLCTISNQMKMNQLTSTDIVWMDLEMTGLDVHKDKILEVSCIITDKDLNIVLEGPSFAINHPQEVLDNMNEWSINHHYESGLVEKCLQSTVTHTQAESILREFLEKNVPKGECPLAGNSIYMDRLFLRQYMPSVESYMHYRIIDVSTVKELARRWNPKVFNDQPKKKLAHRTLDDIKDSINELKYYREQFFKTTL